MKKSTLFMVASTAVIASSCSSSEPAKRPNIIVILADDMGYADLSCGGSTRVETPNLDKMASEGLRLTDFYAQPISGPSRAAFMTGSYPIRVGEPGNVKTAHTVPHPEEITLAEQLKACGYSTALIGKWHLCKVINQANYEYSEDTMPNAQGFDYFYGTPLFNGWTVEITQKQPMYRNQEVVNPGVESWDPIIGDYTREAINWMEQHKDDENPFFLFFSHNMPHIPLGAGPEFKGKNPGDPYADAVEEIDWSVGKVFDYLEESGLDENTLVVFFSDNGPWIETTRGNNPDPNAAPLIPEGHSGTATPLRGYKMVSWEGGHRVPCIVWRKGVVPANTISSEVVTSMDFYPTFVSLAGGELDAAVPRDGINVEDVFENPETIHRPDRVYYYYIFSHLQAVRKNKWKLVLPRPEHAEWTSFCQRFCNGVEKIELYNMETDKEELVDVAAENPAVVEDMLKEVEKARKELGDYNIVGEGARFFEDGPRRTEIKDAWKQHLWE